MLRDIMKTGGVGPSIKGDPVVALTAQINRFRKRYNEPEFPLLPGVVPLPIAVLSLGLMQARLTASLITLPDPETATLLSKITKAQAQDPIGYVTSNLAAITQSIALYGDALGLPSAKVGITGSSWGAFQWTVALSLAALGGVAAYFIYRRRRLLRVG